MARHQRALVAVALVLGALLIVTVVVLVQLSTRIAVGTRDAGALYAAIACVRAHANNTCTPSNTLSTSSSQPLIIHTDGQTVTWYTADGKEWMTTIAAAQPLWSDLVASHITNYQIQAVAI